MDFSKPGDESMSFEFEQHPVGWYAFQILEGIKSHQKEGNPGFSIMIPMQSVAAHPKPKAGLPGDPEAVGGKYTHWIYAITKEGNIGKNADRSVLSLLTITDLYDKFRKKFASGIELTDSKFIEQLAISLPGKVIRGEITHRKGQDGGPQANMKTWERHGKKAGGSGSGEAAPGAKAKEEPQTSGDSDPDLEDWK